MKRLTVPLALLAAAIASAQTPGEPQTPPAAPPRAEAKPQGFYFRVGYGFSPTFNAGVTSHHLDGPEFALGLPIGTLFGQELGLEPSYFGGGRLAHGVDDDSDVYRVTLFLRHAFSRRLRVRAGLGYGITSRARGRTYDAQSGVLGDFGVELPFSFRVIEPVDPYLDLHGIVGAKGAISGFFAGVGVRI